MLEDSINKRLENEGILVYVQFFSQAAKDFSSYNKGEQTKFFAWIVAQARKNPLLKPEGLGEPLGQKYGNNLMGFGKIKPKSDAKRIVYRPIQDEERGKVRMEIIAIGPKNRERVYKVAASRKKDFMREMGKRNG